VAEVLLQAAVAEVVLRLVAAVQMVLVVHLVQEGSLDLQVGTSRVAAHHTDRGLDNQIQDRQDLQELQGPVVGNLLVQSLGCALVEGMAGSLVRMVVVD
jgi:hypothetical protein